ncbi:MAG: hypothetical protein K8S20_00555 [Chloroflexi bacterium]|nr:hypothetical protein [Chloroflexota bacterium]
MSAEVVGFARRAANGKGEYKMTDQKINTNRGIYGRVNITLPLPVKTSMLAWAKKSGMKKAEFLRLALTTGFLELSKGITPDEINLLLTDAEQDASVPGEVPPGGILPAR